MLLRMRRVLFGWVDAVPPLRMAMARVLIWHAERAGCHLGIAHEARDGMSDREFKRTAEMVMWAGAVAGRHRFPTWFPASHHLKDPSNRAASAEALGRFLAEDPAAPPYLRRQFHELAASSDLTAASEFVREDLDRVLGERRPAPPTEIEATSVDDQIAALRSTVGALAGIGERPFLVSGTLLGFARHGRLLEHDYDIDLGLLPGADLAAAADALRSVGFEVDEGELKLAAKLPTGFGVDVFIHYERDGLLWHGTDIHEWWNSPFELVATEFHGIDVWVPDSIEVYLEENYGNWKEPIAFYHFSFDTPNREYRHTSEALMYLYKRVVNALHYGDRWIAESAARELRDVFDVDVTAHFARTRLVDGAVRSHPADVPTV
ncbi:MAG: hypothetical protein AAF945_20585 [Actinomycetota bacterium]